MRKRGRAGPTPRRRARTGAMLAVASGPALALGLLTRVQVAGDSMLPTLVPGDRLLVLRFVHRRGLRPGRIVTVRDPRAEAEGRVLIKRIAALEAEGATLVGDNPAASTDSRTFGPVPVTSITGTVLYRYGPAGRSGTLC
jgi:nickel-type superoxide dismutase maturation protease